MKSLQWVTAGLALFAFAPMVPAQVAQVSPVPGSGIDITTTVGGGAAVKGHPFSADVVHEVNQVLLDGNRIHRETQGKIFRDSEGRVRNDTESEIPGRMGKLVQITINDPAAQNFISLTPEIKTATIRHLASPGTRTGAPAGDQSRERTSLESLRKLQPGTAELPRNPTKPPMPIENLGTREIEGVTATGTRRSRTIAAGEIGNEKPITSVFETWYSEELKIAVLTTSDDPQSGQTVTRLVNIRIGEPDPSIFEVPADYTVKEQPQAQPRP